MSALKTLHDGIRTFTLDVAEGFFAITHSGLALLGLVVFCVITLFSVKPALRATAELKLIENSS